MDSRQIEDFRACFPLISHYDGAIAFLDSAASSQKPSCVIDRVSDYYSREHANIHRGLYSLSEKATAAFEGARSSVASFIGASDPREVIFTKGCTEAINIVASAWGRKFLTSDDEVIVTVAEHHANMVPWLMLQQQIGFTLHHIPLTLSCTIDLDAFRSRLNERTKLVATHHVSNVLGMVQPIRAIVAAAQEVGARVLIDGAQAVPHLSINVVELGVDFYAFSAHKMVGPTGVGVLWGRQDILEGMGPYEGGGDMIITVSQTGFETADIPHKFEAGTPNIAGVLGFEAAIQFMKSWDHQMLRTHEQHLARKLIVGLAAFSRIKLLNAQIMVKEEWNQQSCRDLAENWVGIVSFSHQDIHAHDLACFLDGHGVAVRAGHHCAMPLHDYLNVGSSLRVSPYYYNNPAEIESLLSALQAAEEFFL
ncbi:MAG: cysteine desulfurase [Proteobacteria bacterium]|nr:cysteine desulfurase [Pseudomonadota bacterium]